jgi:hypothetical protein
VKPAWRLLLLNVSEENGVCGCDVDSSVGFEVPIAVTVLNAIFWAVAPSS